MIDLDVQYFDTVQCELRWKQVSERSANVSFPKLALIAISHRLATLNNLSFARSSIKLRAVPLRLALPITNQRNV